MPDSRGNAPSAAVIFHNLLMNKFLLLTLTAAMTAGASAATPDASAMAVAKNELSTPSVTVNPLTAGVSKKSPLKKIKRGPAFNNVINPAAVAADRKAKAALKAASTNGVVFAESFELWNGSPEWRPEGWTIESNSGREVAAADSWKGLAPGDAFPAAPDGNFFCAISYNSEYLDETIVTPAITLPANNSLYYQAMIDPIYLFKVDSDHVDTSAGEFIGEKEVTATIQVRIREVGGEWTTLWDAAEHYKDFTYDELMDEYTKVYPYFVPREISLAAYEGKTVQLGFRYVGTDGNYVLIDDIKVSLPPMEGVSYSNPLETLYFGIAEDLSYLNTDVAFLPVNAPITWSNSSTNYDATYTWTYDAADHSEASIDGDALSVVYHPDYSSTQTIRNNFYHMPTITGSAEGMADGSYTKPSPFFQAGGRPHMLLDDGSHVEFGTLPFRRNWDGQTMATVDYDNYMYQTPIFGHSATTKKFWTEYTKAGDTEEELEADIVAIYNFIYPSAANMVIDGARVFAYGKMDPSTVLTLEIFSLNEDFTRPDTPIATATATGDDFNMNEPDYHYYLIPTFRFPNPVVINADHPGYIVRLSGFNAETVEYFAPLQGLYPNEDYMPHGWITKSITHNGVTRESESPIAYMANEYGDMYTGFAICLDAEYPWLEAETDAVELVNGGVEVKLSSYHHADKLTVEAPAGVTATLSGQYDNCRLLLRHDSSDTEANGTVTISGPGVKTQIAVTQSAGITSVTPGEAAALASEAYTLTGVRVSTSDLAPGLYLIRYSDGSVRKVAVK